MYWVLCRVVHGIDRFPQTWTGPHEMVSNSVVSSQPHLWMERTRNPLHECTLSLPICTRCSRAVKRRCVHLVHACAEDVANFSCHTLILNVSGSSKSTKSLGSGSSGADSPLLSVCTSPLMHAHTYTPVRAPAPTHAWSFFTPAPCTGPQARTGTISFFVF